MKRPYNYPAFPVSAYAGDRENPPVRPNTGMSILDMFACFALVGLLASDESTEDAPRMAYDIAVKMLDTKDDYK